MTLEEIQEKWPGLRFAARTAEDNCGVSHSFASCWVKNVRKVRIWDTPEVVATILEVPELQTNKPEAEADLETVIKELDEILSVWKGALNVPLD